MSKLEIFSTVRLIVAKQLENEPEKVTLTTRFTKDLGADYLDILEIIMKLEEAFNTEFSDLEYKNFSTIQHVVNSISQKVLA